MRITYDVATGELGVDTSMVRPNGTILVAALNRYGQTIPFVDLSFGARVTADGAVIFERTFPRAGEVWVESDQDVIWAEALRWSQDQTIEVHAWIANGPPEARVERETTQAFNVPRPPQPYPSWTWGGTDWLPPVPHPGGETAWEWDEAAQGWVEA